MDIMISPSNIAMTSAFFLNIYIIQLVYSLAQDGLNKIPSIDWNKNAILDGKICDDNESDVLVKGTNDLLQ